MNSNAISLFQNQYGSDEDLPDNLKPKYDHDDTIPLGRVPNVEGVRRKRQNRCIQRVLQWFQWLATFKRRKKPPTDTTVIDSAFNQLQYKKKPCRLSFLFDPSGRLIYAWTMVVSIAFLYNLWIVVYRYSFDEINRRTVGKWFALDYSADFIYLIDIAVSLRTAFIKEGVLQTNFLVIREHYTNTWKFYVDCFSLLPFDFLYLSFGFCSILRCIRLIKMYKFIDFLAASERHTNQPGFVKFCILLHHLLLVFHYNACALNYFSDTFVWNNTSNRTSTTNMYLPMLSRSCECLLLVGNLELQGGAGEFGEALLIFERIAGLLLIAAVIAFTTNMQAQLGAANKNFQAELDGVKSYMNRCRVPPYLQLKVIRWFDYIWRSKRTGTNTAVLRCLPQKLQGEIAIQVHLDTLKRVEIFRNTEPGFLCDLVLRLTYLLFSPGDFVCRKGEVGKEMYIVREGRLHVVSDDGKGVLAVLSAGDYFGEISLLDMCPEGNRRTASVVSCGYCELLCLSQKDTWEVLEDYPNARHRMEQVANKRLHEQKICNVKNSLLHMNSPTLTANRRKSSSPHSVPPHESYRKLTLTKIPPQISEQ